MSDWLELTDKEVRENFVETIEIELGDLITNEDRRALNALRNENFAILYIQMELCYFSLKVALKQIREHFNVEEDALLPPLAQYISNELLLEILESIDYMHCKMSILHRDIKPENIMIKCGPKGKFTKISDFGLAVFHTEGVSHTQKRGTFRYMAPEVKMSRIYDTKADVYSIGVMIQDMFNFKLR